MAIAFFRLLALVQPRGVCLLPLHPFEHWLWVVAELVEIRFTLVVAVAVAQVKW
jgi:hypothetical protein